MSAQRTKTEIVFSRKWLFILAILLLMIVPGCSVDVDGSDYNFDTSVRGGFDYDYTAEKTVSDEVVVQGHNRITVAAINGEMNLEGRDDVNHIKITAVLSVGSNSQVDADLHLDDIKIRITEDDDEILIETIQPQSSYGRGYRAEYGIILPEGLDVTAIQDNGNIYIYDLKSSVDLTNENGDIQALDIVGDIRARLVNGSIETTATLNENGVIDLNTVNGPIELSIPTITSANLSARVDNAGTVFIHDLAFTDSISTPKTFEGTLGNGDGSISLRTINGNIDVFGFEL